MKSAKTYHNRAMASIYCENTSHYFRAQRPVKFCQRTMAMCICACVCVHEGGYRFTTRVKRPLSLISPYTHMQRERSSPVIVLTDPGCMSLVRDTLGSKAKQIFCQIYRRSKVGGGAVKMFSTSSAVQPNRAVCKGRWGWDKGF